MAKKEKEEKPAPIRCKCGLEPITVKTRHGKMVSCRDPGNCCGNYRTLWKSSEEAAIAAWNNLIRYGGENK